MSYELETKNRGLVPEFGFWGPDTTKVMLGELPGMPTPQFCRYATEVIVAALSAEDNPQREEMKAAVREAIEWALEQNAGKKVRSTQSPLNLPRQQIIEVTGKQEVSDGITIQQTSAPRSFWRELNEAILGNDQNRSDQLMEEYQLGVNLSEGNLRDYPQNPFRVEGASIVIGETYVVDAVEFTRFAASYIGGGLFGWDSRGVPDYAHASLEALRQAVQ